MPLVEDEHLVNNKSKSAIRIQLILSILSGNPLKLKNIRKDDEEPGLRGNQK